MEKPQKDTLNKYFSELEKRVNIEFPDLHKSEDGQRVLDLIRLISNRTSLGQS